MAGIRIEGNTSGNVAEVDASNNLKANLPATQSQAGFATIQFENDAGAATGSRYLKTPYISARKRLSVGLDTISAIYNFTAGTQNTGDFKHAFTTMTMTQSAGFLNINPALATVSGNYAFLQSWRHFTLFGLCGLRTTFVGQISAMPPANQILEIGHFVGTAGVAPADGVFFRLTSAGLIGVMSYNGVETPTGVLIASVSINTNHDFRIDMNQDELHFWVDGVLYGELAVPAGQAVPYLSIGLPLCLMMRNPGTVSGGMIAKFGSARSHLEDLNAIKPWAHQHAGQGNAYQGQEGDTMGSLAISPASLTAAAALSNSVAAANFVGLGGQALVLPTLTSGVDGILFSYLNPIGSVTQPPKTLYVCGVSISASVLVILAGGPLVLLYSASFGSSLLTQATTADTGSFVTATVKAPRRVPIGGNSCVVTAAAGTQLQDVQRKFDSPMAVNPGEYFQILMRNVGIVTTTGSLAISAFVDHYFE